MIPPIPVSRARSASKADAAGGSCRPLREEPVASPEVDTANSKPEFEANDAATLQERTMTILKWALIFLVVSIIAGLLGFTGVSIISADIARFLFYVFAVIFLVLLILGLTIFRV
jgi:uncharacterized membrane protein YtjA (UPF0391 family)